MPERAELVVVAESPPPAETESEPTGRRNSARPDGHRAASSRKSGFSLSWSTINFWLDALLAALFLSLLWTLFVLRFAFPPGPEAAGWTLWGRSYVGWFRTAYGLGCALGAAIVLHVMFHWTWICGVVSRWFRKPGSPPPPKDDPKRTILGVMFLIGVLVVMGIGLAAAIFTIQSPM